MQLPLISSPGSAQSQSVTSSASSNTPHQPIRSSSFSFHPKEEPKGQISSASVLADSLLETPTDLVCPITLQVFRDPVITTSGQVYERDAITSHIKEYGSDPKTRVALRSDQLTPVYLVRARAAEYRETAAAACVDAASSPGCPDPVRYVRRAVELADGINIPGLSSDCAQYVAMHPSNAYDVQVMEIFAQGLFAGGHRDSAGTVYASLLNAGVDKAQQCQLLSQCLECWAEVKEEVDEAALRKLEGFIENHTNLRWSHVIDLVEAGLGRSAAVLLCEHLLFPNVHRSTSVASEGPESKLRDIMLKYVQLQLCTVRDEQAASNERWGALEASMVEARTAEQEGQPGRERHFLLRRPAWLNSRAFASAALTVATLGGAAQHPVLRLLRLIPLLYLIPPDTSP